MAMSVELAEFSLSYKFHSQQLKVREATEKLAARARWRELSKERVQTWDKFRNKHHLQSQDRPDSPVKGSQRPERH
jgi:hypothetical protein